MIQYDLRDSAIIRYDFKRFAWHVTLRAVVFFIILTIVFFGILAISSITVNINNHKEFVTAITITILAIAILPFLITVFATTPYNRDSSISMFVELVIIFTLALLICLIKVNSDDNFIDFDFDYNWLKQHSIKALWAALVGVIVISFSIFCFKVYKFNNAYNLINLIFNDCVNKEYSKNEKFIIVPDELLHINFNNCDKNLAKYFIDEKES